MSKKDNNSVKVEKGKTIAGVYIHTGNLKEKNGITMVALVVTIVILLILAGISISTLTNTGIFEKAKDAKDKAKMGEASQKMSLLIYEWQTDNMTSDKTLETFLEEKVEDETIENFKKIEEEKYQVFIDGYVGEIDETGKITKDLQKAEPHPIIKNVKITIDGKTEIENNSQAPGTQLQINFDASIEGGKIKSITPELPYITNGTETEVTFTVVGTVSGKDYETTRKISVINKYKLGKIIDASDIAKSTDKNEYYGKVVEGYTPQNNATVEKWRIFYADSKNIYLIANDYVEREYLPEGTDGTKSTGHKPDNSDNDYERAAILTNILQDYEGSSRITDSKIKALNKEYFKQNFSSTYNNMKAVAYMLDTKAWEGFKDTSGKADYAIGGPTVELLINSYNQRFNKNLKYRVTNSKGYDLSKDNGSTWSNYCVRFLDISNDDGLYVIKNGKNARAMWLASTSSYDENHLMNACWDLGGNGSMSYYSYYSNGDHGFRPIICLKTGVKIQEFGNSYILKK